MGESIWQKNSLVTLILFDLCLFEHFSPVANFAQQSIQIDKFDYIEKNMFIRLLNRMSGAMNLFYHLPINVSVLR